jgi:hypothetical protein
LTAIPLLEVQADKPNQSKQIAGTHCWWLKVRGDNNKSGHSQEVQDQYKKLKGVGTYANAKKSISLNQPRYQVYGLQKTFAKDINGIMASELNNALPCLHIQYPGRYC